MNILGLTRADQVVLTRMTKQYTKDQLPHPEQIRQDVQTLALLAVKLDKQIEKMAKPL